MEALSKSKGALGLALLFVVGIFAYNTFLSNPVVTPTSTPATAVGADLLKLSQTLSRATLSRDLFAIGGYKLLRDFSAAIQSEPLGRVNPFAPFGQ